MQVGGLDQYQIPTAYGLTEEETKEAFRIAHLACCVGRQSQGVCTARACGDWEYVNSHIECLDQNRNDLLNLVSSVSDRVLEEARTITNAYIPTKGEKGRF